MYGVNHFCLKVSSHGNKTKTQNGCSAGRVMNVKMKLNFSTDVYKVYNIYFPKGNKKII